ncbi:Xanthine phosphoribosyltransferase 1 [Pestalotiopsis sp. 9143b]|nr:Xanthine phosphoribosyltransferase 1 [Pestalotiopsis sp. 9143b]
MFGATMQSPGRQLRLKIPMSPIEHSSFPSRTLTSRPVRKALWGLVAISVLWLLLSRTWGSVANEAYETYNKLPSLRKGNAGSSAGYSQQWVGGGAVVPPTEEGVDNGEIPEIPESPETAPEAAAGVLVAPPEKESKSSSGGRTLITQVPDVIRISFEEAVRDVELDGWEDDWFSSATFDAEKEGPLAEPKIDFVYNWVNGSEESFKEIRHNFELQSPLNDPSGKWIAQHSINRYRDWDELRYSMRSVNKYAKSFINKIQILVNSVNPKASYSKDGHGMVPQRPTWLKDDASTKDFVEVLGQEQFFGELNRDCLPTFNSLSIEAQLHMTKSSTDRLVALSDDMFLGMQHAASDFYSPLFGSVMGFKTDSYNVNAKKLGSGSGPTFGEKPFAHYTSYLLNRRFGERPRRVQAHFGHSISRSVMKETMASFPEPARNGACERFRGESRFQIYPWYANFHYTIERFREALLWSYIMSRSDTNSDGYLDWSERENILKAIEPGWRQLAVKQDGRPAPQSADRERMYYHLPNILQKAGLQPPKVNVHILWTSLDGPETIRAIKCSDFSVDECFADSFGSPASDTVTPNPDFTTTNIFSRISKQRPDCGDCIMKFLLASTPRGLEPLLPPKSSKKHHREIIIKALKKYQHTVIDIDAMKFVMIKDAEQAQMELLERTIKQGEIFGQWCLNDDVMTESPEQVTRVKNVMKTIFETLWPKKGHWEKDEL